MSVVSIKKNKIIRDAFYELFKPMLQKRIVQKVFKTDQAITRPNVELPCVCVFLDEGEEIEQEKLDNLDELTVRTSVVIKVLTQIPSSDLGDDVVDDIAQQALDLLNTDLTLGGILNNEINITDYFYERDSNQMYTALVFGSNIEFYDD